MTSRPDLRRLNYDQFLSLLPNYMRGEKGEAYARNIWRRLVEVVKGAVYNASNAAAETLTFGQIVTVVTNGREQFPRMPDERWKMVLIAAGQINAQLPSYTNRARSYDMLKDFVVNTYQVDQSYAARLWTVLVSEGLGIYAATSELRRIFWVPDTVIIAIASADPGEYRNLGEALIPVLRAWRATF